MRTAEHPKAAQGFTVLQLTHLKPIGDICHRMIWPARLMARQRPAWRVVNMVAEAEEHYRWAETADLLVLSQSLDLDLLPVIARRRHRGLKTLVEYVDNFYAIPPTSNAAGQLSTPLACQSYELIMEACDAVIVTGPGLRDLLSKCCRKPIHIIENHYPEELPPFEAQWRDPGEGLVVGWGGSPGHMADILAILPMLRQLVTAHPRLRVHLMGDASLARYSRIDPSRFHHRGWGSMDDYLAFLDGLHLGVIPLRDTPFNRCRSDIKAVEMIARGVLPLMPDLPPYHGLIGATGLAPYRNQEELARRILFYLEHPERLREDARCLYEHVRSRRVAPRRDERLVLYEQMLPASPLRMDEDEPQRALPPGYHEIQGTPMTETPTGALLRRYGPLLEPASSAHPHALGEALAALDAARRDNPWHPDLALLGIRLAIAAGGTDWEMRLADARRRFPGDLRFELVALRQARTPDQQTALWSRLIPRLAQLAPAHRDFYENEVVALLGAHLQGNPASAALAELAERLLDSYPEALPLRQVLALYYEAADMPDKALSHFQVLAAARKTLGKNSAYLARIDGAWLDTWCEALAERRRYAPERDPERAPGRKPGRQSGPDPSPARHEGKNAGKE